MSFGTVRKVAFIGNHTPRQCGLATFTADICLAVANVGVETQVVAVNDGDQKYEYPECVSFEIEQDNANSYLDAASYLNSQQLDLVCVQHEFGIFGGPAGAFILYLLKNLNAPIVTTLHTIIEEPSPDQRLVIGELAQFSERCIVMSPKGKSLLKGIYDVDPLRVSVISHGIPPVERVEPEQYVKRLGLDGKRLILTFGLLSPSKGIEFMIEAMPEIIANSPDAHYLVVGATHPTIRRHAGESYRSRLVELSAKLGVASHVSFVDRFVSAEDLTEFLNATSVYVTPYLNKQQITSGTLARAYGSGKAVVSTPYWHAEDLLSNGCGVLVPFRDAAALAKEINALLSDQNRLKAIQDRAYEDGQRMTWPAVIREYVSAFEEAIRSSRSLLPLCRTGKATGVIGEKLIRVSHLDEMVDDTGIIQHAFHNIPNRNEGYCTDDNARLGLVGVKLEEDPHHQAMGLDIQGTALAFLLHAFNPGCARMRNFMTFERTWMEELGSEDSHGRALWALGVMTSSSSDPGIRSVSGDLFLRAMPVAWDFNSARGYAFSILGLVEILATQYCRDCLRLLDDLAERLN